MGWWLDHWWFFRIFLPYPSEKSWSESPLGWLFHIIPFPTEWKHEIHVQNISKPPTSIPNQVKIDHASRDWHPVRSFLSLRTYFTKLRKRVKHLLNCKVECWTNTRWVCSMNKSNTGWVSPTKDIVEKQKTCIAGEPSDHQEELVMFDGFNKFFRSQNDWLPWQPWRVKISNSPWNRRQI